MISQAEMFKEPLQPWLTCRQEVNSYLQWGGQEFVLEGAYWQMFRRKFMCTLYNTVDDPIPNDQN